MKLDRWDSQPIGEAVRFILAARGRYGLPHQMASARENVARVLEQIDRALASVEALEEDH